MILSLKNISKSFDKKTVLSDFSYDFPDTGIVALTGPSGAGKTTLLRIICRLDKKHGGEVVIVPNATVSVAFQEHRLLPNLTAEENVYEMVFDKPSGSDIIAARELLSYLGFGEAEFRLYPSELSGGMKQRVSLARAFLRDANILLLDEPTKELDSTLAKLVLDKIVEYSKRKLVIIVSHSEDELDYLGAEKIRL